MNTRMKREHAASREIGRRCIVLAGAAGLGLVALTSTGCVQRIALRDGMRANYPYQADETAEGQKGIDELQLYSSERILLRRRHRHGDKRVKGGKIVSRKGKQVEEVVVWAKTPGVVVDAGDNWLDVSFAEGTKIRFAVVEKRDQPGEAPQRTVYRLHHRLNHKGKPVVEFEDETWRPVDRSTAAILMVRREAHGSFRWQRTRLRGMRVGEG